MYHRALSFLLVFTLFFLSVSCHTQLPLVKTINHLNEDVVIHPYKIQEGMTIPMGTGSLRATKGHKLVTIKLEFKSNLKKGIRMELRDFRLYSDSLQAYYTPDYITTVFPFIFGLLLTTSPNPTFSGKWKRRSLIYQFPLHERPGRLVAGEYELPLLYRD